MGLCAKKALVEGVTGNGYRNSIGGGHFGGGEGAGVWQGEAWWRKRRD